MLKRQISGQMARLRGMKLLPPVSHTRAFLAMPTQSGCYEQFVDKVMGGLFQESLQRVCSSLRKG